MTTLFLDRRGSRLETDGSVILLEVPAADEGAPPRRERFPLGLVERIVAVSRVETDSLSLAALAQAGVSFVAFGGRRGERIAQLDGALHADGATRIAQAIALCTPPSRAALARLCVLAKLRSCIRFLGRAIEERPEHRKLSHDALLTLHDARRTLLGEPEAPVSRSRGLEGAAARAYYAALFALFPPEFHVTRRLRRPPPDPVNAALSLGYALATGIAAQAARSAGLDPAVGFLHGLAHGRPALACDLVEPLRADIDRWTWRLFAERTLRADHFGREGSGACLLGKSGRAIYYQSWATLAEMLERSARNHARCLARALRVRHPVPAESLEEDDALEN